MALFDHALTISLCCGLGRLTESTGYEKDSDCLACLKDLQKILRHDDPEKREAFFFLSEMNISRTDLVPLILTYPNETEIVYHALKVLTFLSMPIEPGSEFPMKQRECIHNVKKAVVLGRALKQLVGFFANHLNDNNMRRDDTMRVQLTLVFIRNLLCTVDGGSNGRETHEAILNQMIDESIMEVLIALGQRICQANFKKDAPVLVQIFFEIFRYTEPEALLGAQNRPKPAPRKQPNAAKRDGYQRRRLQIASLRGLRFGGVIVNKYNDLRGTVVVKDTNKNAMKRFHQLGGQPPATAGVASVGYQEELLVKLRVYAEKFLEESYNTLMGVVTKELEPGLLMSNLDQEDFLRFFKLAQFFTRYISLKQESALLSSRKDKDTPSCSESQQRSPFDYTSTTTSSTVFRILQSMWLSTIDCKVADRDTEMQGACIEYLKEMLFALDLAARKGTTRDKRAADKLQRRMLQDDNRTTGVFLVLAQMVRKFNPKKTPRKQGIHLCEALHLVLKTYERLVSTNGGYAVKKKKRKVVRRKRKSVRGDSPHTVEGEENRGESNQEDGGNPPIDLPGAAEGSNQKENGDTNLGANGRDKAPMDELMEELDESDSDGERPEFVEVDFDLNDRIRRDLARPEVVQFYVNLLRDYARNGEYVNHCIVSFLRRLSHRDHLNMVPLLYQVSHLRVFQKILRDPHVARYKAFEQVKMFSTNIVSGLVARLGPKPRAETHVESIDLINEQEPTSSGHREDDKKAAERKAESAMHDACGRMLFVEMLFPKQYWTAELIQKQYNWRDISQQQPMDGDNLHEEFRIEISEDDDIDDLDAEKVELSEDAREVLRAAFEENNGRMDCYEAMSTALGSEQWPKEKVIVACRQMGLRRGNLTEKQGAQLKELYSDLKGDAECDIKIARALPGGFDALGVHRLLLQMKLVEPPKPAAKTRGRRRAAPQPTVEKDVRVAVLKHFENNNGKKNCYENIAMALGEGWTSAKVRGVCKKLGLKKGCLTDSQEIHLREIHSARRLEPKIANKIASVLSGGFGVAAIRRKMREMGLIPAAKKRGSGKKLELVDGTSDEEAQEKASSRETTSESDAMSIDADFVRDAGPSHREENTPDTDGHRNACPIRKRRRLSKLVHKPSEDVVDVPAGTEPGVMETSGDGTANVDIGTLDDDLDDEGVSAAPSVDGRRRLLVLSSEDE